MKARTYSFITNACVLVAVASALVFDRAGSVKWLVAAVGAIAGIVSVGVYIYNQWNSKYEYHRKHDGSDSTVASVKSHADSMIQVAAVPGSVTTWEDVCHTGSDLLYHRPASYAHTFCRFAPSIDWNRMTSLELQLNPIDVVIRSILFDDALLPPSNTDEGIKKLVFVITMGISSNAGEPTKQVVFEVKPDGQIMVHAGNRPRISREDYAPYKRRDVPFVQRQLSRSKQKSFQEVYGLRHAFAK